MSDVFELLEAEIVTSHNLAFGAEVSTQAFFGGGKLAAVLKGLAAANVDWWLWIGVAIKLLATVNPTAAEVIQKILDAIKAGLTPATFASV